MKKWNNIKVICSSFSIVHNDKPIKEPMILFYSVCKDSFVAIKLNNFWNVIDTFSGKFCILLFVNVRLI